MNKEISKQKGDLLVIWITCYPKIQYIAEIVQERRNNNPMIVKVMEEGSFSCLKDYGDFGIMKHETTMLQEDDLNDTSNYFLEQEKHHRRVESGLKRLGVEDGKLHYIYSSKEAQKEQEEYWKDKEEK